MSINITNILNTLNLENITIPKYNWVDIASGEISIGNNIIVAINGNSDKIIVSRDNGATWENSSLGVVNSWRKISWSPLMKRFCVIAYDSDVYMLSNPITTLTGDLSTILVWNKRDFYDLSSTNINNKLPASKWNDITWISGTITNQENYNTFLLTSSEYSAAYVAFIEEVAGSLDIVGWKPHMSIPENETFLSYEWKDLCSTSIKTVNKTPSSPQFVALGLKGDLNIGKFAVSNVGSAGNFWVTYDITSNNNWSKINYHPICQPTVSEISLGAFSDNFLYIMADNGDIAYSDKDNFESLTVINVITQPNKHLSAITLNKFSPASNVTPEYISNNLVSLKWNNIYFIESSNQFIAVSNLDLIATSYDLENWTYNICENCININNIIYVEEFDKYVAALNNNNKIMVSSDLNVWDEYIIETGSNLNNIVWVKNTHLLYITDNNLSQLMYLGKFYQDGSDTKLNITSCQFNTNIMVKNIITNTLNDNAAILTNDGKILISNIDENITECDWSFVNLSQEYVSLFCVDFYSGNYSAITNKHNYLTSNTGNEFIWKTYKINTGLDSFLSWGNKITKDENSGVVISSVPIALVIQKYGHYKISSNFTQFTCKNFNNNLNWKSVCWSEHLQKFCVISSNKISAIIDTEGNAEYGKIPILSAELMSIEWISSLQVFLAVSKCNEYVISYDGINWFKSYFNSNFKYTKIYHDSSLNKTFILSNNNKIAVYNKIIEEEDGLVIPSDWPNIQTILNEDTTAGYLGKFAYLVYDYADTISLTGGNAYRTSDGAFYTEDTVHTWNMANDFACSLGYNTRWVIVYLDTFAVDHTFDIIPQTLWIVFDCDIAIRNIF